MNPLIWLIALLLGFAALLYLIEWIIEGIKSLD